MTSITVATDGACKKNPGPTGWAWVTEDGRWEAGSLAAGTNNVGELLALLNALVAFADVDGLTVLVDSSYVIDSYTKWADSHARRGWVTAAGTPVANRQLLEELLAARDARRSRGLADAVLVKVKGHSGNVLNAWADIKAVEASNAGARGVEDVRGTSYGDAAADTTALPAGATIRKPAPRRRGPYSRR